MKVRRWSTRGHASRSAMKLSFRRWFRKIAVRSLKKPIYPETPGPIIRAKRMVLK